MQQLRKFVWAVAVATVMGSGIVAFGPTVHAAGPGGGGGRSNQVICSGLQFLYDRLAPNPDYADAAQAVKDYAASIGCAWAQ